MMEDEDDQLYPPGRRSQRHRPRLSRTVHLEIDVVHREERKGSFLIPRKG